VTLQAIADAAQQFRLSYDDVVGGYTTPHAMEADLAALEALIAAYRQARRAAGAEG
jgi:hypothetical protein